MKTFEFIVRVFVILLISGVVLFGVASVYLNVFEKYQARKREAKRWSINAK
jgi:Tfp pilus assembly protein PilW